VKVSFFIIFLHEPINSLLRLIIMALKIVFLYIEYFIPDVVTT